MPDGQKITDKFLWLFSYLLFVVNRLIKELRKRENDKRLIF